MNLGTLWDVPSFKPVGSTNILKSLFYFKTSYYEDAQIMLAAKAGPKGRQREALVHSTIRGNSTSGGEELKIVSH